MQTFLPYSNFEKTAKCLDNKRLNKQIVEGVQILQCIMRMGNTRWRNHPVVKMWVGYETSLYYYICACYIDWKNRLLLGKRGGKLGHKSYDWICRNREEIFKRHHTGIPYFLGNEKFHNSHKASLLFKNPEWYSQFDWEAEPEINYFYPVRGET